MQQTDKRKSRKFTNIGFIGAGKAGFTLGRYFAEHGARLSGYYSRNGSSAREAARFTESWEYKQIKELAADSDILFLTVPDGSIKTVWDELATCGEDLSGKLLCHASGSVSSQIFEGADIRGADTASLHPLFAISDKYHSFEQLDQAVFTIEGNPGEWRDSIEEFIRGCGNKVELIAAEYKSLYHTAAVIGSNFLVGLSYLSSSLLRYCGFSPEGAEQALLPLMKGSMDNIIAQGAVNALTGPVERNDCDTIRKHLQALAKLGDGQEQDEEDGQSFCVQKQDKQSAKGQKSDSVRQERYLDMEHAIAVYRSMTSLLIAIGCDKHEEIDYSEMRAIVEQSD